MTVSPFDPANFFRFDMTKGLLSLGPSTRAVLVSEHLLSRLFQTMRGETFLEPLRQMGQALGAEVKTSLGGSAKSLDPDTVVTHLAGVIALSGWGRCALERWGDAMAIRVENCPGLDANTAAIEHFFGGVFTALGENKAACLRVGSTDRFLILSEEAARRLRPHAEGTSDISILVGKLIAPRKA